MLVHAVLFILTLISTLVAGAIMQDYDFATGGVLEGLMTGVSFSVPLLVILGSHEFAHYFNSRRHGVRATLPYFIPFPNIFGTMGAVIKIKSPIYDRRALIDIGASGPIVGFVFAVAATAIGLYMSGPSEQVADDGVGLVLGGSILFDALADVIRPEWRSTGLQLHPFAIAGWVGFFVTSINLMPVGQLDGGHISYAFFGGRARAVSKGFILVLAVLGYYFFMGWFIWAALLIGIGLRHPPVYDEHGNIGPKRIATGVLSLVIFIVTFSPMPVNAGSLRYFIHLLINGQG